MQTRETIIEKIEVGLDRGIEQGIFPGGIACLSVDDQPLVVVPIGTLDRTDQATLVTEQTVYDLASLTKVVVTLPLFLLSVQAGKVSFTDPITTYLPELKQGQDAETKERITMFHLLTHTSGLPGWRPYFILTQGKEAYIKLIGEEPMAGEPGKQVVYSDLGFMLLGFILERIWEEELSALADRLLFQPMGMVSTTYNPLQRWTDQKLVVAPTEEGNRFEFDMVKQHISATGETQPCSRQALEEKLSDFRWRQGFISGTVHDCNAYYGLGGVSGHAGLFSTVEDLERYMRIWTSEKSAVRIDPILRQFATRKHTGSLAPTRAIGWEASATGGSIEQIISGNSGGDLLSASAFGHTGFTGTSIWHDSVRRTTLIMLTNRVHPTVSPDMIRWRRAFHNQIFSLCHAATTPEGKGEYPWQQC